MTTQTNNNADAYDAAEKAGRAAYENELAQRSPVGESLPSRYGKKGAAKKRGAKKAGKKARKR